MTNIEIEIDGRKLSAEPNQMVIQVADAAGIYIPRFCYHKQLSIAANCRMCLVEIEKAPKTLPACATPAMSGMKVFTRSPKALAAQKAVMEFLLINHPLDCPICDQGGECELQDLSMGYGAPDSHYNEGKRAVKDQNIGPLIATDMTRCIHCTRCVRFGAEVAGMRELGALGRGEHMEIGTYIQHAMHSEVSGNVIDLCPVGALTSKPFRFTARAWELTQRPTISPHDCTGSNLHAHIRDGKVMRMVPRENMAINAMWIADRDRFSYEGLYHTDRVAKPQIKQNGVWQTVDWPTALEFAATGLQRVIAQHSAEQLGALASPNATLEEFYLLQKLWRSLGSNHIDHRLRQVDFSDQHCFGDFPGVTLPIPELEQCDTIFLIGSHIQKEQPALALRLRKAFLKGTKIVALNVRDYPFHFDLAEKQIVAPDEMVTTLKAILQNKEMQALQTGKRICILLGQVALNHPEAAQIRALAQAIATATQATLGLLTEGANAAGAWLAGAIPHRTAAVNPLEKRGLNAETMLTQPCKAYLLLNVEPDVDCANPIAAISALQQAEFVIALALFQNPILNAQADVILPIVPFTETSGTFVNMTGKWQHFNGVTPPFEEARPAWKVLRVLGNLLHLPEFDYTSTEEVQHELQVMLDGKSSKPMHFPLTEKSHSTLSKFVRIGEIPLYSTDSLVRRAKALQFAQPILEGNVKAIRLHPETAQQLKLKEGDKVVARQKQGQVELPLILDNTLPTRGVYIAGGIPETAGLGELFGELTLS